MMSFVWQQIKQVCYGGMPALRRKTHGFPSWFLGWFGSSRFGSRMAYYGSRIAVFLMPHWAVGHALLAVALIRSRRLNEAFVAWERAFLLKPDWPDVHSRISTGFLLCGQRQLSQSVLQRYIDAQNNFAREHQLDKLGIRFLMEFPPFIGHTAMLDSYVKMGVLGQRSIDRPIVLADKPANKCYLDYWRRYLPDMITDPLAVELLSPLAKYLEDHICGVMDSSNKQIYEFYALERASQSQWEAESRGPLLTLTRSDYERGWECLRDIGAPSDGWFVCIHVNEGKTTLHGLRNADISTYLLAVESIVARGGWVIRMGDPSMKPLPPMPHVIDYAHSEFRNDWMDVFLWSQCRFFIGTHSGPHMVPPTFGVPCVITNWASLGIRLWFKKDLHIFKLSWSESKARYLNFAEVISSESAWALSADYLASVGIKLVDNTPEEINDVVVEMMDRLEEKLVYSKEDEELQERFDRLYVSDAYQSNARIGRDFLRKWEHLL